MSYSKQITLVLCTLMPLVLLGGYVAIYLRGPVAPETVFLPPYPDDPEMHTAYIKAQDQLDYFLKLSNQPPEQTKGFAIKVRLQEGEQQEFFWLYPFEYDGEDFAGRLNDDPSILLKSNKGDIVTFTRRDIVDWTFDDTRLNIMHGNFTGCVELMRKAPDNAAQFQEFYGLDCSR